MRLRSLTCLPFLLVALSLSLNLHTSGLCASPTEDQPDDPILAQVGDEFIYERDLNAFIDARGMREEEQNSEMKNEQLERLVMEKLWQLGAKEQGMTVDELKQSVTKTSDSETSQIKTPSSGSSVAPAGPSTLPSSDVSIRKKQALQEQAFLFYLSRKYPVHIYIDPMQYSISLKNSPVRGPENAPVTFVEFSDFECYFCGKFQPTLQKIVEAYEGKVRFVFKHFPLSMHAHAKAAHSASLCAHEQGRFWDYRTLLFDHQNDFSTSALLAYARQLNLDETLFKACLNEDRYADRIDADVEEAIGLEISGTPTFFINGRRISGAQSFRFFQQVIDEELTVRR
ncbi:MAG: hypothetical protein A3J52_03910 [Omnitrophica bacterium RIFCSPHIGHO2_02_FULL_49_9]|nr:MAG: hypothetical protein A3J52_03910 [Omnitrophica bacterium RIFCSPHIGHO2_02_FULL_49_9]